MSFEYLTNTPLAEARRSYLKVLGERGFGSEGEIVPVQEACGRITAEAVYAHGCAPHYAASAMDGIAVHAADTFGATDTTPVSIGPIGSRWWIRGMRYRPVTTPSSWWRRSCPRRTGP